MRYLPEAAHRHDRAAKLGILLVNLGTPDAPTPAALRRYLGEFLWDPRVVEIPRPLWWLILKGVILNTRPRKSAAKYAAIWTDEGSPLLVHTRRQATLLKGWLGEHTQAPFALRCAMRYGQPSIASALDELRAERCDRLLVLPLYPQYAASTTASAADAVFAHLRKIRTLPALRLVRQYHDHPAYIAALAANVRDYWQREGQGELLLMSFHGLPRRSLTLGDPYHCHCQKTARLLAERLGLAPQDYRITFQSRFGRAEWLQPYTAATLAELGRQKLRRLDVICPGFVADCLETLEEIAIEGRATFLSHGGGEYRYIPALNEHPAWISALGEIALENLQGWLAAPAQADVEQSALRARAMGAEA